MAPKTSIKFLSVTIPEDVVRELLVVELGSSASSAPFFIFLSKVALNSASISLSADFRFRFFSFSWITGVEERTGAWAKVGGLGDIVGCDDASLLCNCKVFHSSGFRRSRYKFRLRAKNLP
jgi:hypothetical protein